MGCNICNLGNAQDHQPKKQLKNLLLNSFSLNCYQRVYLETERYSSIYLSESIS